MTFRAGRNPDYTPTGTEKQYVVLRHVPVDSATFAYTGGNLQNGLLPNMTQAPTWKYASPHNIKRVTAIQSSCNNCHGQDYAKFWLTNAIDNGEGWISTGNLQDETDANAGIVIPAPFPYTTDGPR
jgi:hypothetical protein